MTERPAPISEGHWFYVLSRACLRIFFGILRLRAFDAKNVPATGRVILACNHQSYFDPIIVGSYTKRKLQFMARDTLFRNRLFGALLRTNNTFPVKLGKTDVTAIKQSLRLLKENKALLLFPEGTRTPDGRVHAMQPGVLALARRSRAAILPVAVEGVFEAWPRGAKLPRWVRMYVQYGLPIAPEVFEGKSEQEAADLLTHAIRTLHNELRVRAGRTPFEYAATDDATAAPASQPDVQGAESLNDE